MVTPSRIRELRVSCGISLPSAIKVYRACVESTAMNIDELNQQECLDFLSRASVARLACSRDGQPYVVPIGIAYDADYIYCFSTEGMKIDWMRANPKICLQADEIKGQSDWVSVVV